MLFNKNEHEDVTNARRLLSDILDDLEKATQACSTQGRWIKKIEHRCPTLLPQDDLEEGNMSWAQRTHQIEKILENIKKNCYQILCLLNKYHAPETIEICQEIHAYLSSEMISSFSNRLINALSEQHRNLIPENNDFFTTQNNSFKSFFDRLGNATKNELNKLTPISSNPLLYIFNTKKLGWCLSIVIILALALFGYLLEYFPLIKNF